MKKVICIGEALIDWICTDKNVDLSQGQHFIKKAGGAPFNVAIAIARLEGNAEFFGSVGNDPFGKLLKNTLIEEQVLVDNFFTLDHASTTFAFVSLFDNGERDFIFQRNADALLDFNDLKFSEDEKIWHFGSATGFLEGKLQETYYKTLEFAKSKGEFISFDPNFRTDLWRNNNQNFIKHSLEFIKKSDFVKMSEEELFLVIPNKNRAEAVQEVHKMGAKIVVITLGSEGSFLSFETQSEVVPTIKVTPIDTTGAGDAFVGGMLWQISKKLPNDFNTWKEYVSLANIIGAKTTTAYGAIEALPKLSEIRRFTSQNIDA